MSHPLPTRPRMALEPLEDRSVPAVALVNGVVHITGTPGPDQITITAFGEDPGYSNQVPGFTVFGASRSPVSFRNPQVGHVIVDLGEGNDKLTVVEFEPATLGLFTKPMIVFGRGGNDVIEGGLGNDLLDGGPGADKLFGKDGNDAMRCGQGNDEAEGGAGDDGFRGDAGDDRLRGGAGHDRMFGGPGADTLEGGIGNDILYGGGGADALSGGEGADVFLLQAGDTVSDYGPADARIHFADGRRRWTEAEVMGVEVGVNALLKATGAANALRRPNGEDYTFLRHGIRAGGEVVGNDLQGTVLFIDRLFTNPGLPAWRFLLRELGRD